MTLDYFLTKRKRNIKDWLEDHNILSVEGFLTELVRLGLEPSREHMVLVEGLFTTMEPDVRPQLHGLEERVLCLNSEDVPDTEEGPNPQETKLEISESVDSEPVVVPPSSLPNKKSRKT